MAKYNLIKLPGGAFAPANDVEAERLERLKTGCTFEVDIKQSRNQKFHGKVFAFFTFCFEYYFNESANGNFEKFEWMRKRLTVAAGFYIEFETPKGTFKEPKSLSFATMEQEEFEACYKELIQTAMNSIFKGCDNSMYDRLYSFF